MEKENNFKDTVNSLFKGMDGFVSAKTVVGDAIHVGDTIILPLVDVSFGVGAGAFEGDKKNNGGGGLAGKMSPCPQTHCIPGSVLAKAEIKPSENQFLP